MKTKTKGYQFSQYESWSWSNKVTNILHRYHNEERANSHHRWLILCNSYTMFLETSAIASATGSSVIPLVNHMCFATSRFPCHVFYRRKTTRFINFLLVFRYPKRWMHRWQSCSWHGWYDSNNTTCQTGNWICCLIPITKIEWVVKCNNVRWILSLTLIQQRVINCCLTWI